MKCVLVITEGGSIKYSIQVNYKYIVRGEKTKNKKKGEDIQDKEHKALKTKTSKGGVEINKELKITTQTVGDRL